jgi:hypothetical protein
MVQAPHHCLVDGDDKPAAPQEAPAGTTAEVSVTEAPAAPEASSDAPLAVTDSDTATH